MADRTEGPKAPAGPEAPDAPSASLVREAASTPRPTRSHAWFYVIGAALLIGGGLLAWRRFGPSEPVATSAFGPTEQRIGSTGAIPRGAMLLASFDVQAILASPLFKPYRDGDRQVKGLGGIRQACGFDPIARVDELTLAIPQGEGSDFGIAATGGFSEREMLGCADTVIAARGGKPISSSIGSFRSVRDPSQQTQGEVAARSHGLLLFSGGGYLRAMVDAADGHVESAERDEAHLAIRRALSDYGSARVSLVLSPEQRAVVTEELEAARLSAPAAIGRVGAMGAGLRLSKDRVAARWVVSADSPDDVPALREVAVGLQAQGKASPGAEILGVSPLLDRLVFEQDGAMLTVSIEAAPRELELVLERALRIASFLESTEAPSAVPEGSVRAPAEPAR